MITNTESDTDPWHESEESKPDEHDPFEPKEDSHDSEQSEESKHDNHEHSEPKEDSHDDKDQFEETQTATECSETEWEEDAEDSEEGDKPATKKSVGFTLNSQNLEIISKSNEIQISPKKGFSKKLKNIHLVLSKRNPLKTLVRYSRSTQRTFYKNANSSGLSNELASQGVFITTEAPQYILNKNNKKIVPKYYATDEGKGQLNLLNEDFKKIASRGSEQKSFSKVSFPKRQVKKSKKFHKLSQRYQTKNEQLFYPETNSWYLQNLKGTNNNRVYKRYKNDLNHKKGGKHFKQLKGKHNKQRKKYKKLSKTKINKANKLKGGKKNNKFKKFKKNRKLKNFNKKNQLKNFKKKNQLKDNNKLKKLKNQKSLENLKIKQNPNFTSEYLKNIHESLNRKQKDKAADLDEESEKDNSMIINIKIPGSLLLKLGKHTLLEYILEHRLKNKNSSVVNGLFSYKNENDDDKTNQYLNSFINKEYGGQQNKKNLDEISGPAKNRSNRTIGKNQGSTIDPEYPYLRRNIDYEKNKFANLSGMDFRSEDLLKRNVSQFTPDVRKTFTKSSSGFSDDTWRERLLESSSKKMDDSELQLKNIFNILKNGFKSNESIASSNDVKTTPQISTVSLSEMTETQTAVASKEVTFVEDNSGNSDFKSLIRMLRNDTVAEPVGKFQESIENGTLSNDPFQYFNSIFNKNHNYTPVEAPANIRNMLNRKRTKRPRRKNFTSLKKRPKWNFRKTKLNMQITKPNFSTLSSKLPDWDSEKTTLDINILKPNYSTLSSKLADWDPEKTTLDMQITKYNYFTLSSKRPDFDPEKSTMDMQIPKHNYSTSSDKRPDWNPEKNKLHLPKNYGSYNNLERINRTNFLSMNYDKESLRKMNLEKNKLRKTLFVLKNYIWQLIAQHKYLNNEQRLHVYEEIINKLLGLLKKYMEEY